MDLNLWDCRLHQSWKFSSHYIFIILFVCFSSPLSPSGTHYVCVGPHDIFPQLTEILFILSFFFFLYSSFLLVTIVRCSNSLIFFSSVVSNLLLIQLLVFFHFKYVSFIFKFPFVSFYIFHFSPPYIHIFHLSLRIFIYNIYKYWFL